MTPPDKLKNTQKSPAFSHEKAELKSQFCKIDTL